MAKWQFADKARKDLEEQGIVFHEDGTVSRNLQPQQVVADQPQEEQPTQTTTSTVTEQQAEEDKTEQNLLEMQRLELEQLRAEKEKWEQGQSQSAKSERETELEQEIASLRSQLEERTAQEQADEVRELLERQGFDSENLDDDVILELRDTLFKPLANKLDTYEKRLAKFEKQVSGPTPEEKKKQLVAETNEKIHKEIPDFKTIFNSKAFQDKLAQNDPRFPTATYGQTLQVAYDSGNADFIVKEVKAFLSGKTPSLEQIADVGATSGVGKTTDVQTNTGGFTFTDDEATQMLRKRQFGTITRQEYSEYRAKLDAHRSGKQ